MRTGKSGYYKRVTATDTSTSLTITVHDSDDAVGASADLHSKMFTKTSKAIPTSSDPLDALDLPFFQMGNSTSQLSLANRPPPPHMQLALLTCLLVIPHKLQLKMEDQLHFKMQPIVIVITRRPWKTKQDR